jgi:beta-phosphoglucomutase-like phosphatase (HAD superfamily)
MLDPFLAAKCLGYRASRCVIFEDSLSRIEAGIAAGGIVVKMTERSRLSRNRNDWY